MNVRNLFTDDDAVSPVIGVILMVAITVILAAVIGAFVLNIGGSQAKAPQAQLSFTNNTGGDTVNMTHQGGDELDLGQIEVKVTGSGTGESISGSMAAGDTKEVVTGAASGDEVDIVWNNPSGGSSNIIAEYTVP